MNSFQRRRIATLLGALLLAPTLQAQTPAPWPSRPVRIVVPAPAGGGTDILARMLAESLGRTLQQPFIVDNKPGANGLIASDAVAHAAPDGAVFLFSYTAAMVINPGLFARAPDPVKDFEPVAQVGSVGNVLVVSADFPARNLSELLAHAKQQTQPLNYGSWGIGSGGQLMMESILKRAGVQMSHVPYKGTAEVNTAILGGSLKLGWTDTVSTVALVKSGKLRALAVSGTQRVPQFPDVPTLSEQGIPFETTVWYGLFAPARTPAAIVNRLNSEVIKAISQPEFQARLKALNMPVTPTPDAKAFRQRVIDDAKTWRAILQDLGIQQE
ncbi:MAG: tripartite tricarboxylate transporter substrate binding protein [Pseudomonadota bacterium]|mgnify:CR=1 FL=1|jgi:tripartite-type tricarboxylate transporter receptor subunit TctC